MSWRWIGIVLTLLLIVPPASAQQKVPGVTDTEVVIGVTTPLSGPAAAWGNTGVGMEAWAKYINDQGGVHGRKIRVVLKDDGYVPGRALANLTEMKDSVFAVVGLLGTAIVGATKDFFADNKLPLITAYGNVQIWAKMPRERLRYVFVSYPDYADEAEFLTTHAVKQLGVKKLAVFFQNDDYGKGGLEGVHRALKALAGQASVVAEVPYELTERELGTHALKLKDSGAEAVILYPTTTHGALLLKGLAQVGFRPKLLASFPLGDPLMFRLAGELWEGAYVNVVGSTLWDPEAQRVVEIMLKYEPKLKDRENFGLFGATSMMTAVEGLRRAGRDLTREKLVEAMETIKEWRPENLGAPNTYGPNQHHGANLVRLMRAEKGKLVPVTGYQTFRPLF